MLRPVNFLLLAMFCISLISGCNHQEESSEAGSQLQPPTASVIQVSSEISEKPEITSPQLDPVATQLVNRPIFSYANRSVSFTPDNNFVVTGNGEGYIRIWNTETRRIHLQIDSHSRWVFDIAYSHDHKTFATAGGDHLIKIWDTKTGMLLKTLKGHSNDVHAVAFTPDDKFLYSGGDDTYLFKWNLESGEFENIGSHKKQITSLDISPDGELVATGSRDSTIKLTNLRDTSQSSILKGHKMDVMSVQFSPDGKSLLSSSYDHSIKLWDISSKEIVKSFTGHSDWLFKAIFTNDGQRILSSSRDNTLKLWSVASGKILQSISLQSPVSDLAISTIETVAATQANAMTKLYQLSDNNLTLKSELGVALEKQSIIRKTPKSPVKK